MAKPTKATKKFEKNRLTGTLTRRKDFAKTKQRHQLKAKKQKRTELRQRSQGDGEEQNTDEHLDVSRENGVNGDQTSPRVPSQQSLGKRKRNHDPEDIMNTPLDDEPLDPSSSDEEDLGIHKGELEALAAKDPAFYKYLKENDAELLDFNEDAEVDALDGADSDDQQPISRKKNSGVGESVKVTAPMIKKWTVSLEKNDSTGALRQLILAFRSAAHLNDEKAKEFKYAIPDADIYHQVLVTAMTEVPQAFSRQLPIKETAAGKLRIPTDSSKFKTLSPLIKSYASSLHYVLGNLSDTATLKMTLQSFEPVLPYLLQFRKFLKVVIKTVTGIWSDNSSDDATRISAFLIMRKLMITGDAGVRESVLRACYEGIVRGSRNTTIHTLPGINLMKNSAAELWGLDKKVAYTTSFTFIRQLAITLRANITKPTKDSYKKIYNWQFVHSLDFWARVLAIHCNSAQEREKGSESELRPLIYPTVQITLGVIRLVPNPVWYPLRFLLIRALLRISQSTGTYIPIASLLLEVLQSADMKQAPKPSTQRTLDFESNIRAPTSYLKTRVYQDGLSEQLVELFSEFFALWSKNIAFPELQLPVVVMIKRWLRSASAKSGNKNAKANQALLLLVQKLESNARWIEERRNKISFAPKNRVELDKFLQDVGPEETPFGAFMVSQRHTRAEKKKVLDQGRQEDERRKKRSKMDEEDEIDIEG